MKSPDLLGLEEVQDNTGAANDGTVDANLTLDRLAAAIVTAGGPAYSYRQVNPVNGSDGGEPGGNIRVAFFYRTDRGLAFVDAPGGGSTTANSVLPSGDLAFSPGRIDPTNTAFNASRKPLAGQFTYAGKKLFVIVNHFNSKGGDDPLFGRRQPPVRVTETQRHQQATIVRDFSQAILAANPAGNVVVLGDLNDFHFSQTASILEATPLHTLLETLPANEQYTYVFEGNSQSLDHILVSDAIFGKPFALRRRARERGVRRPGLRPRPAAREARAEPRAVGLGGRAVHDRRGRVYLTLGQRVRSGRRRAHVRLGSRRQRHVRDERPVADLHLGRRPGHADGDRSGVRSVRSDGNRGRDGHGDERGSDRDVHRARHGAGRNVHADVHGPDRPVRG